MSLLDALYDPQFRSDLGNNARQLLGGLFAGTVGAPVDIATMLMRPFGYSTPDNKVVGSSEHIAGLLGMDTGSLPYQVGSLLPTDPTDALKYGGLLGHVVYHGSPHKFDKFSMDKIGTGEGAQAYGHGLYFAENPGVAGTYKRAGDNPRTVWEDRAGNTVPMDAATDPAASMVLAHGSVDDALRVVQGASAESLGGAQAKSAIANSLLSMLRRGVAQRPAGSLYKADIADSAIPKMLDWDKPLSEQPHIRAIWEKTNGDWMGPFDRGSGADLIRMLNGRFDNNPAAVSAYLNSLGIPGIRYLDGGSRAGGKGTSNFVLFDDSLVKILSRE